MMEQMFRIVFSFSVVVVIVLIVLIVLVSLGLVFYARRKQIWCFSSESGNPDFDPDTVTGNDPEMQKPLQQDPNERPIIKSNYRRPT